MKTGKGFLKQTVYIRPDQYLFLQERALNNRIDEVTPRPDLSFVIRDIIDRYKEALDNATTAKKESRKRG